MKKIVAILLALVLTLGAASALAESLTIIATPNPHAEILELVKQQSSDTLTLSTEACAHCAKCTYPDAPCRFPESLHPSIESHGVEVNVLAGTCGIRYHNGKNTVTYHTCVFFNEPENN